MREITRRVRQWLHSRPRSLQTSPGPSDVGGRCDRRVAYALTSTPRRRSGGDPWPAAVGVAIHGMISEALRDDPRWEVDLPVEPLPGVVPRGTADLYDRQLRRVIDIKTTRAVPPAPGVDHENQLRLYALGLRRLGLEVASGALWYIPRGDLARGAKIFEVDVSPAACELLEARLRRLQETPPEVAATADECRFCPFFRPGWGVDSTGCGGVAW